MSGAQLVDGGELDHIPIVEHGDVGCAAVQHGEIVAADDLGTALPDVVERASSIVIWASMSMPLSDSSMMITGSGQGAQLRFGFS